MQSPLEPEDCCVLASTYPPPTIFCIQAGQLEDMFRKHIGEVKAIITQLNDSAKQQSNSARDINANINQQLREMKECIQGIQCKCAPLEDITRKQNADIDGMKTSIAKQLEEMKESIQSIQRKCAPLEDITRKQNDDIDGMKASINQQLENIAHTLSQFQDQGPRFLRQFAGV